MDEDSNLTEPDKDFDDVTDITRQVSKAADSEKEDDDAGTATSKRKYPL